ncbi:hypothetical protein EJ05DRAFT_538808 [Pseudovirgaria hyperparasitica]|uniref:Uncharacterized protein n=1 Tax=Pseudovirgaria hyperparasitica TaxID=470096 RepID=A0A6A6W987_9PEZI|nr:uncharacterized protein EJ05DRAFT_538808 [Pseudovirgaria hyperparasitica]KAF2757651.1 hypothetical protein EJ05DRAFT_538808 [Pseudovirgaria hyperparasitica]
MLSSPDLSTYTNLVIVCCHAIYLGSRSTPDADPYDEIAWLLQHFQKSTATKQSEHETFIHHVTTGLNMTRTGAWRNKSILVISGGRTKRNITELSESESYYHALLHTSDEVRSHAQQAFTAGTLLLEEHATDSYQNLLFSIIAFRKRTGRYPGSIRVVTHAFKARRFLELHANAIRWPKKSITVSGIDPPMDWDEYTVTTSGEASKGYMPWTDDPHGVRNVLSEKRRARGWDPTVKVLLAQGLESSVQDLVHWNGGLEGNLPFPQEKKLVWELDCHADGL